MKLKINLGQALTIKVEMGRLARGLGVSPTGSGPRGESLFMTGIYRRLLDLPGTQAWWAQADRRGIPNGAIAYIDDYLGLEYSGANR